MSKQIQTSACDKYVVLPSSIQNDLLERAGAQDKGALLALVVMYSWYIRVITKEFGPDDDERAYEKRYAQVLRLFEKEAQSADIDNPEYDFPEAVLVRAIKRFKQDTDKHTIKRVKHALEIIHACEVTSFEAPIGEDGTLEMFIAGAMQMENVEAASTAELEDLVRTWIDHAGLKKREREVLQQIYIIGTEPKEAARILDLSKNKLKSIEEVAIRKLRSHVRKTYNFSDF